MGDDGVDEGFVDAGVADVEEADFEEGVAEGVEECGFGFWVSGEGEVEDGDRGEGHWRVQLPLLGEL